MDTTNDAHHGRDHVHHDHGHHNHHHDWHLESKVTEYDQSPNVQQLSIDVYQNLDRVLSLHYAPWSSHVQQSIIDFGCGPGKLLLQTNEHANIMVGVDYSKPMLECFKKNASERNVSEKIRAVEFDIDSGTKEQLQHVLQHSASQTQDFDLVLCTFVAHHVRNVDMLHEMLLSVAKPGGIVVYFDKLDTEDEHNESLLDESMIERKGVKHSGGISLTRWREITSKVGGEIIYAKPDLKFDFGQRGKESPVLCLYIRK